MRKINLLVAAATFLVTGISYGQVSEKTMREFFENNRVSENKFFFIEYSVHPYLNSSGSIKRNKYTDDFDAKTVNFTYGPDGVVVSDATGLTVWVPYASIDAVRWQPETAKVYSSCSLYIGN